MCCKLLLRTKTLIINWFNFMLNKTRKETFEKQEKDWAELLNMLATYGTINDIELQRKKR